MIVFFQVMLRRALGVEERCENDGGPDLMPDVTWHLAAQPAGGQAVRTTDCQPSDAARRRRRQAETLAGSVHTPDSYSVGLVVKSDWKGKEAHTPAKFVPSCVKNVLKCCKIFYVFNFPRLC